MITRFGKLGLHNHRLFQTDAQQALFQDCYRIIEKHSTNNFPFWDKIKKQVALSENIISNQRVPTSEELNKINFGPTLASVYDSREAKEEMEALYQVYKTTHT